MSRQTVSVRSAGAWTPLAEESTARSAGPDGERLVDYGLDAADADAFEHADLCTDHEEAFGQPRAVVAAAFVADIDRLLVRRASCSVAEVEERFEPVEGPADPALDLVGAWHLLDAGPRELLRAGLRCNELEWERGKAWAFEQSMGAVWYYAESNPPMSRMGQRTIDRILDTETEV